jgi:uncharacterized membrane protein (UPF0127 family)
MTKHILFPILLVGLFIAVLGILIKKYTPGYIETSKINQEKQPIVKIGNNQIKVEVADSEEKRIKGLSNRESIEEDKGMLFIFPKGTKATFWMKDMKFDIDIIWIADQKVVKIDKNAKAPSPNTPDNKLTLYKSEKPIDYVLEVKAGFADTKNIKVGDSVELINI